MIPSCIEGHVQKNARINKADTVDKSCLLFHDNLTFETHLGLVARKIDEFFLFFCNKILLARETNKISMKNIIFQALEWWVRKTSYPR